MPGSQQDLEARVAALEKKKAKQVRSSWVAVGLTIVLFFFGGLFAIRWISTPDTYGTVAVVAALITVVLTALKVLSEAKDLAPRVRPYLDAAVALIPLVASISACATVVAVALKIAD